MTFCITGNRPEKFPFDYNDADSERMKLYRAELEGAARELLMEGYDKIITGMARGVDLDFALCVLKLKAENPEFSGVILEAAVPYRSQPSGYEPSERAKYDEVIKKADKVTYVCERYVSDCFFKRNMYMVDNADLVLAVWNERESGGTYGTMKYAFFREKKIKMISLKRIAAMPVT